MSSNRFFEEWPHNIRLQRPIGASGFRCAPLAAELER
jgi:hypothetical protein